MGAAGAASARSDKASLGSGTRQDVMASKEPEREREGERQRDREGDKEADKEREKLRLREKASETEAWVASVVDAMGKNSASTVAAKVLPRLALLKDLKVPVCTARNAALWLPMLSASVWPSVIGSGLFRPILVCALSEPRVCGFA